MVYKKEIKTIKDDTKYYLVQSKDLVKNKDLLLKSNVIILDDLNIFFIRGDVKGDKREEIRKMFELQDGGILIATYGTLSTGVNIKKIHNIHLASSIKSFITLNQSIGRGMRQHETKDKVRIWDYVDDFTSCRKKKNYILKHADERINLYLENAYPIIEKEIQLGD
jgi:superfamily II DNA or RNA helicase